MLKAKPDAVVVIGSFTEEDMLGRVMLGLDIVKKYDCSLIVVGTKKEVDFMKHIALRYLDSDRIMIDNRSKTTIDNAYYAKIICTKIKAKIIALITSDYQLERAKKTFEVIFGPEFQIASYGSKNKIGKEILEREITLSKLVPLLAAFKLGDHETIKNTCDLLTSLISKKFNCNMKENQLFENHI